MSQCFYREDFAFDKVMFDIGVKSFREGFCATVYLDVIAAPQQVNGQIIAAVKSSGFETLAALQRKKTLRSLFGCWEEIVKY
ncbi:hypothetical protein RIF29_24174 [Crotalaria pallida]|uniref:Uncharacterized protein n=1 Tax=Crotalaria pallida TaxID=3830 RepID=A0AAN9HWB4_CROPI